MSFQSPFNNMLSRLQDMGIITKLMDNGYYEAFGRNVQINFSKSLAEKWEPLMTQGMILVFVAFGVGLMLANLTFIVELSGSAWLDKQGSKKLLKPTMYNHHVVWRQSIRIDEMRSWLEYNRSNLIGTFLSKHNINKN